jgi:hypothetical protein
VIYFQTKNPNLGKCHFMAFFLKTNVMIKQ